MEQKITVPAYDLVAAEQARSMIRDAADEAFGLIRSFGRDYGPFANHQGAALRLVAALTPEIVRRGKTLECELSITRRGGIEINVYDESGRQLVYTQSNIGPFETGVNNREETQFYRLAATIDNLLKPDPIVPNDDPKESGLRVEPYHTYNP